MKKRISGFALAVIMVFSLGVVVYGDDDCCDLSKPPYVRGFSQLPIVFEIEHPAEF